MSYSFDGTNDRLTGAFASTYSDPMTLACFIKQPDHLLVVDALVYLGNSSSSNNDSYSLRADSTDDRFQIVCQDNTGATSTVAVTQNIDGVWAGILGRVDAGDVSRALTVLAQPNNNSTTFTRTVADALQFIALGENLAGSNDFTGNLAEIAIWNSYLSGTDITSYMSGIAASLISPSTLIGYWPLSSNSATHANLGLDTGGLLTVSGATFDSDHPIITGMQLRHNMMMLDVG